MRTDSHPTLQTVIFAVVALGLFHIARPLAVSAQSSATLRAEATVLPASAAWAAHRLTEVAARPDEERTVDRYEESGAVAWREEHPAVHVVTVAHLGS